MSQLYGPYNSTSTPPLASAAVTKISVTQNAGHVVITNNSITTDMLVDFGQSQPPVATQVGGQSWAAVVHPGDTLDFEIQSDDRMLSALGEYWQGIVWIQPLDTASQLNITGLLPSIGNVWITVYAPGEPTADRTSTTPTVSQVGQQRAIAVPVMGDFWAAGGTTVAAGTPQPLSATTGTASTQITAASLPNDIFYQIFIYFFSLYPLTAGNTQFNLVWQVLDSGAVVKASAIIAQVVVSGTAPIVPAKHESPYPIQGLLNIAAHAGSWSFPLTLRLVLQNASGTTPQAVNYNIQWSWSPDTGSLGRGVPAIAGGLLGSASNSSLIIY